MWNYFYDDVANISHPSNDYMTSCKTFVKGAKRKVCIFKKRIMSVCLAEDVWYDRFSGMIVVR